MNYTTQSLCTIQKTLSNHFYKLQKVHVNQIILLLSNVLIQFVYGPIMFLIIQENVLTSKLIQYGIPIKLIDYIAPGKQLVNEKLAIYIIFAVLIIPVAYIINLMLIPAKRIDETQLLKNCQIKWSNKIQSAFISFTIVFIIGQAYLLSMNSLAINTAFRSSMNFGFKIIGFLNFILLFSFLWLKQQFLNSYSVLSPNLILPSCSRNSLLTIGLKMTIYISWSLNLQSFQMKLIFYFIMIFISFQNLKKCIKDDFYRQKLTNEISIILNCLQFWVVLLSINYSQVGISLLSQNFVITLVFLTIFSYFALRYYKQNVKFKILHQNIKQLKTENEFISYIMFLYELYQKRSNDIFLSLSKQHISKCKDTQCQCHKIQPTNEEFEKQFLLLIIKIVQKQSIKFQKVQFTSLCLKFLLTNQISNVYFKLNKMKQSNRNSEKKFEQYCFQKDIEASVNQTILENSLNQMNEPIILEKVLLQTIQKMKKFCISAQKRYKYFSKGICRINQLEEQTSKQLAILIEIDKSYNNWKSNFKKSLDFQIYHWFFFTKIVQIGHVSKQIKQQILNNRIRQDLNIKIFQSKDLEKVIFSDVCCTLESFLIPNEFTKIHNATKSTQKIFGYTCKELIGIQINLLMPKFIGNQHLKLQCQWTENGNTQNFGKLRGSFGQDKEGNCFETDMHLGMRVSLQGGISLVGTLLKGNQFDCILINKDKQIQSYGKKIKEIIGFRQHIRLEYIFPELLEFKSLHQNQQIKVKMNSFKNKQNYLNFLKKIAENQQNGNNTGRNIQQLIDNELTIQLDQHVCKFKINHLSINKMPYHCLKFEQIQNEKVVQSVVFNSTMKSQSINIQVPDNQLILKYQCQSVEGDNQAHTFNQKLGKYYENLKNPSNVESKELKYSSIIVYFLIFLMMSQFIGIKYFYLSALNEIKDISEANANANTNLQLAQYLFDSAMQVRKSITFQNGTQTPIVQKQNRLKQNLFYKLLSKDVKNFFTATLPLTNFPQNKYLQMNAQYIFQKSRNSIPINSLQFLQFEYYFAKKYTEQYQTAENILQKSFVNFPVLKKMVIQTMQKYRKQIINMEFMVKWIGYLNIGVCALLAILLQIVIGRIQKIIQNKFQQIQQNYSEFSRSQFIELQKYYLRIEEILGNSQTQKLIQ